jgi:hypothetical protein
LTGKRDISIKGQFKICSIAAMMLLLVCGFATDSLAAATEITPDSAGVLRDIEPVLTDPGAEDVYSLPLCIPAADESPSFESVRLSSLDDTAKDICFTGAVTDDVQLSHIRVVVRTHHGYGFEIVSAPIDGTRMDLSGYCIRDIYELLDFKQGNYDVILSVKDRAGQVASKTFFIHLPDKSRCLQNAWGGQCVNYVRRFFGGRQDLMPGLCVYADCGAYHAWDTWDLGHGKGSLPAKKSILVLDRDPLEFGHVAVVLNWQKKRDGTYLLMVNESNWDQDELIDCNVRYTYFPDTATAVRHGRERIYRVAGFIYTQEPIFSQTSN